MSDFLNVSLGNILTIISLLLAFWLAHRANIQRIEDAKNSMASAARQQAVEFEALKTKVDIVYDFVRDKMWNSHSND